MLAEAAPRGGMAVGSSMGNVFCRRRARGTRLWDVQCCEEVVGRCLHVGPARRRATGLGLCRAQLPRAGHSGRRVCPPPALRAYLIRASVMMWLELDYGVLT